MTIGIPKLLAGAEPVEGGFTVDIPVTWLQGRTAYGGLSSALALHAAKLCEPDLPPLRSAMVAFIGPLAGKVTVTAEKLRRGRNAAFIEASIRSEAGLGYRATFVFMADVPSSIVHNDLKPSPHKAPTPDTEVFTGKPDFFGCNFNFLNLRDQEKGAEWMRWARLIERDGLDPEVNLIAIADCLPPAAFALIRDNRVPMSSLTWIVNVLVPRPTTTDGWFLLHTKTDRAIGGYSSQHMTVWNADGVPVVDAMQGVAVFG